MKEKKLQDKCRGSLLGGAAGDALGYEVEFMRRSAIINHFGEPGIREYVLDDQGIARFSDDTQMSLFTAEGLLSAVAVGKRSEREINQFIGKAYLVWLQTQLNTPKKVKGCWLAEVEQLWSSRAPGTTCLQSLMTLSMGGAEVVNNSKGCGGVMRVAPIGIFAAAHPDILNNSQAGNLAGLAAEITHDHKLSTFSSVALAMIVAECIESNTVDRLKFNEIVIDQVFQSLAQQFRGDEYLYDLFNLCLKALALAETEKSDADAIRELGEGWVAEETLAIALFATTRYIDDFEKCMICAVNHDGDSDSTGAVAGNILGAILGFEAIPEKFKTNLELKDLLVSVADDLAGFSSAEQMRERYGNHR